METLFTFIYTYMETLFTFIYQIHFLNYRNRKLSAYGNTIYIYIYRYGNTIYNYLQDFYWITEIVTVIELQYILNYRIHLYNIRIWKHYLHLFIRFLLNYSYWITELVNYLQDSRTWTVSGRFCCLNRHNIK